MHNHWFLLQDSSAAVPRIPGDDWRWIYSAQNAPGCSVFRV